MLCPNCNALNREQAHYCGGCGCEFPRPCPRCGTPMKLSASFCAGCGALAERAAPLPRAFDGALPRGTLLEGRYWIESVIAVGGFGRVYLALDQAQGGKQRAIKEPLDKTAETQRQFEREAKILLQLDHPHLVKVIDYFDTDLRDMFLVMDYIPGEDLRQKLEQSPNGLPEDQVIGWALQVCDVLEYLHGWIDPATGQSRPIIHRDIKPGNLKLPAEDTVIVIDLGIFKVKEPGAGTTRGARAVSAPYSPTEQYFGGTDERSDIYALGVTMYQLATGQEPPAAPECLQSSAVPPRQINASLGAPFEEIILKAMEPNRDDRFRTVGQMRACLWSIAQGTPQPADWPSPAAGRSPQAFRSGSPAPVVRAGAGAPATAGHWPGPRPALSIGSKRFIGAASAFIAAAVLLSLFLLFGRHGPAATLTPVATATQQAATGVILGQATETPAGAPAGTTASPRRPLPGSTDTPTRRPATAIPSLAPSRTPGTRGADRVVSFEPGPGALAEYRNPSVLLGEPDGQGAACCQGMVQLGKGGSVILAFEDNAIVDAQGPDFVVYGETANDDFMLVEVSLDGRYWYAYLRHPESTGGLDLATVGLAQACFVRLTDMQPGTSTGAEVDAVLALHSGPAVYPLPILVVTARPTPSPTRTPRPTTTRRPQPTPTRSPAPALRLVADSLADFSGGQGQNSWEYLFAARNSFRWTQMGWDGACYKSSDPQGRICADQGAPDAHNDIAWLYKAETSGRLVFKVSARKVNAQGDDIDIAVYRHTRRLYLWTLEAGDTQGLTEQFELDAQGGEMFFFTMRISSTSRAFVYDPNIFRVQVFVKP